MSLLQYTSQEMFSSTELIRKSKMVFDKITNDEIEKAVILRDGKPSFMLMDFAKYEALINEYLELKNSKQNSGMKNESKKDKLAITNVSHETKKEPVQKTVEKVEEPVDVIKKETQYDEIDNSELEKALAEIENLDLNFDETKKLTVEEKKEQLKDFWE